jgi:methylglutaconyl-CoA hydratase
MAKSTLRVEQEGAVATITLNRPEKRNAICPELIAELVSTLAELEAGDARVLILTGAGKAFCSGMDLEALAALAGLSHEQNLEDSRRMARLFRAIYSFPKPTIAAVNGAAMAGGCGIATLCDFTLAAPEARFGYTEVKIGFLPAIVSVFLLRQIGEKQARDLLLTGRDFDAAEAARIGLVTEIVPAENLLARAGEIARSLLAASPTSIARLKSLLRESDDADLDRLIERAVQANAAIRSTADFREGLAAFLEKRAAKWTGG